MMSFYTEGFTGAGRTIIWKSTPDMIPRYALSGTGLEMFRVAFLPYKTAELARISGGVNPEDPHNAYLSSLLSTGIVSTALFFILIVAAVRYLLLSIRRADNKGDKLVAIGLLSSMSGVMIHNIFIFPLIPTGLYFFLFLSLSYCWHSIVSGNEVLAKQDANIKSRAELKARGVRHEMLLWLLCCLPLLVAANYAHRVYMADRNVTHCLAAAQACNYQQVLFYGEGATNADLGQTDYHCYFAMGLESIANRCPSVDREAILKRAVDEMGQSLDKTLLGDVRLLYLAELNMALGNLDIAVQNIEKAARLDAYSSSTHLVRAKLHLLSGDIDKAKQELSEAKGLGGSQMLVESVERSLREAARSSSEGDPNRALDKREKQRQSDEKRKKRGEHD
jgi:tetratricopeptide (TPR) repeat protein